MLLHQFHDILPGSSIAWVHREARAAYAEVARELNEIIDRAVQALAGAGDATILFDGFSGAADLAQTPQPVRVDALDDGGWRLDNGRVEIAVDARGLLTSAVVGGRETLCAPANLLQLHQDFPNQWDAWDVDEFYRNTVTDLSSVDSIAVAGGSIRVTRSFGSSTVEQTITLVDDRIEFVTAVDWHEREKFLKVAFPLDIHSERYAAETQFGHLYRPTHTNTSWDAAKFEACNHRFIHVEEPGFGTALVNDSTYGPDVTRTATTTTVRMSLLRAPRFPDPHTDQGKHTFRYALLPGATIGDAVAAGYRINLPVRPVTGGTPVGPLVTVDNDAVVISAVKLADDESGDVIVRLYEARGGRAAVRLIASFDVADVQETDLLERPYPADASLELNLRAFQMVTLRLTIAPGWSAGLRGAGAGAVPVRTVGVLSEASTDGDLHG